MKVRYFFSGLCALLLITGTSKLFCASEPAGVQEVTLIEDLMREHGILSRVLLIYEELNKRLISGKDFDPQVLKDAASIIRKFIENYHEKSEEEYIFTRFEKDSKMADLIKILKEQHQAGRLITDYILAHASEQELRNPEQRQQMKDYLDKYVRMYRPHEAREDTVLFPAFKALITPKEYEELGIIFEKKEHALFGEEGFKNILEQVARMEKILGIYNLYQFTPKLQTEQASAF